MMDWTGCPAVEVVEGRCGGRPTIRGTRLEPGMIMNALLAEMDKNTDMEQAKAILYDAYPSLPYEALEEVVSYGMAMLAEWNRQNPLDRYEVFPQYMA